MARWNSLNRLKLKSTARKADSGGEKRSQTEVIGSQFVLEFVNASLHSSSAIVIAPDFQRRVAAIGDKDPEHITRQVDELATYGRLGRLELLAHNDKVPRAFPILRWGLERENFKCADVEAEQRGNKNASQ